MRAVQLDFSADPSSWLSVRFLLRRPVRDRSGCGSPRSA